MKHRSLTSDGMSVVRVEVTAEDIARAGDDRMAWAAPVEDAIARLFSVGVSVDGSDVDGVCVATIGTQEDATLVVDLPASINAWLDARWEGRFDDAGRDELAFEIELPAWIYRLCGAAVGNDLRRLKPKVPA